MIQPVQPVSLSQDSLSVLPGDEIYRQAARLLGVYMGAVDPDSSHLHKKQVLCSLTHLPDPVMPFRLNAIGERDGACP